MRRCAWVNGSLRDGDRFHIDCAVRRRMALSPVPDALTQPLFSTAPLDHSQAASSLGRETPGVGWTVLQQVSVVGARSSC